MSFLEDLGMTGYVPDLSKPRYTQDYFPIDKIEEGLVVTKDGRYLKIVEVMPINFDMKNDKEKDNIIDDFEKWLLVSPYNVQIKIVASHSDPTPIIEDYIGRMERDKDYAVKKFIENESQKLVELGSAGVISVRFYVIFSFEQKADRKRLTDPREIANEMQSVVNEFATYMRGCGSIVTPLCGFTNYSRVNESYAIGNFLYQYFNPRTSSDSESFRKISFQERCNRIYTDSNKAGIENKDVDIASLISPTGISVQDNDCVIMDGKYYTSMIVRGDGYPTRVYGGWLNILLSNLEPGDSIDIFLHKEDVEGTRKYVARKVRDRGGDITNTSETRLNYEQLHRAYQSAIYMKEALANGEKPFYVSAIVTLSEYKYNDLIAKRSRFLNRMVGFDISLDTASNIQEETFKCTFPLISLTPKVYQIARRNVMSSGLASFFPFISYEKNDKNGFCIGLNLYNNSLFVLNPYERPTYSNSNYFLGGITGKGKTYFLQSLALKMRASGIQNIIIAPDKPHEFARACTAVKGEYIKISGSSEQHVNIMDIYPRVEGANEMLDGVSDNSIYVSDKAQDIITFLQLVIPDMSNEEQQLLDISVIRAYKKYGITDDNNSIFDNNGRLKKMPVLGDVYAELKSLNNPSLTRILNILSQFTEGSMKSFNARTNVDLTNKYIVFDVAGLQKNMLPAGMFIVLNFINNRIKADRTERKMIHIDEGWKLIGSSSVPKAAEYVEGMFRTIRAYNGGVGIATQQVTDVFALEGGKYGNSIISNAEFKILLGLSEVDLKRISEVVDLTEKEKRDISRYPIGKCLVVANDTHVPVSAVVSSYCDKLITTDPAKLKQIYEEIERYGEIQ